MRISDWSSDVCSSDLRARWKRVLGMVEGEAGEAMGELYVKTAFPASSKASMEQLVGNLRTALKARIEQLSWMSDETKQKALAKWATFTPKIGYPDRKSTRLNSSH